MKCKICGAEIEEQKFVQDLEDDLKYHQMCFHCNFWRSHLEHDKSIGKYDYAIINGGHYLFGEELDKDGWFKGFGGRRFYVKFKDGHMRTTDNLWFQGEITDAHPHWRELMPDTAEFVTKEEYEEYLKQGAEKLLKDLIK